MDMGTGMMIVSVHEIARQCRMHFMGSVVGVWAVGNIGCVGSDTAYSNHQNTPDESRLPSPKPGRLGCRQTAISKLPPRA